MVFWKSTSATSSPPTPASWKQELCRLEELPMLPTWAVEALELANQPDSSLRDLARLIQRDLVLSAGILKLANSSLYCSGREVTSVEQAVVRLGVLRCRHAILAVGMRTLWHEGTRRLNPRWTPYLWYHALLVGHLASRLAQRLRLPFQGEELVAGLAHDLGRLVFALHNAPTPRAQRGDWFLETADTLSAERQQLGADHTQIGAWFAQINRLPAFLADVAEFHHAPDRAGQHQELVGLIAAAEDLANLWYAASQATSYFLREATNQWLRHHFGCSLNGSREIPPSPETEFGPYRGLHPVQVILQQAVHDVQQNTW
ncbi:MAG: HDOD domain-containing protein [Gemmatales bacterium]|nr:HDOD domain-containing protein [Gemmatales bacterium]MDW8176152.1 HDOD domain-containing protein [Gemmatales bacterium]